MIINCKTPNMIRKPATMIPEETLYKNETLTSAVPKWPLEDIENNCLKLMKFRKSNEIDNIIS